MGGLQVPGCDQDKKCTIVLVDDSEDDMNLLIWSLRKHVAVEIRHFSNGKSAYDYLHEKAKHPDTLIVLDLNLPGLHGTEILEKLKSEGTDIPRTIIFSGSDSPDDKAKSLQAGADGYYTKPWEISGYEKFVTEDLLSELKKACPEHFGTIAS